MKSVSVVIPLFNRNADMADYVIRDMLEQDIDEVVIANTGTKRLNFKHPNVIEVWNPLHKWLPGITRNMGATVANGEVQVHMGADIITASGSWGQFRELDDYTSASASCGLLNEAQTQQVFAGQRVLNVGFSVTNRAVFGLTKRVAMLRLKGPFDWQMIGWGWVDVDLKHGVHRLGMRHRELKSLKVLHLAHGDGSSNWRQSIRGPNVRRNRQLLDAKDRKGAHGWWSNMTTKTTGGFSTMDRYIPKAREPEDCLICGELDFHTIPKSVERLKAVYKSLDPGKRIFVTFNDVEKLGPKWERVNQKNTAGRRRITFWTESMMRRAIADAGFEQIVLTDRHIGRHVDGLTTLIGLKSMPKPACKKAVAKAVEPDVSEGAIVPKASVTSRPKRKPAKK